MKPFLHIFIVFTIIILSGCGASKDNKPEAKQLGADMNPDKIARLQVQANSFFSTLPAKMPGSEKDNPQMVELGKKLFFDKILSINNTISCNTCHVLDNNAAGVDNQPTSSGAMGKKGKRNSPTVLNAGFHFAQFWDGRASNLIEQAKGPIINEDEMVMPNGNEIARKVAKDPEYKKLFAIAFKEKNPVTFDNIAKSIAAFEHTLITHDRVDEFLDGNKNALTKDELVGLEVFINTGCVLCHTGPAAGGTSFQKIGLVNPYSNRDDMGRYTITKNDADKYVFKVASLRNVALTAPYFHDGSVASLNDAVAQMSWLQTNKKLSAEETNYIVKFLGAFTDKSREKKKDIAEN